jgi:hypothetical protein
MAFHDPSGFWVGGFGLSLQQQFAEFFCWSVPCQGFAGPAVEFGGDGGEAGGGVAAQAG